MAEGVVRVQLSREAFDALGVQVAQPQATTLLRYSEFAAEAAALPGRSVSLTAPISGRLVSASPVNEGELVKKDQVLFTVEPLLPPEREVPGLVERRGLVEQRIARERARSQSIADLGAANTELEVAAAEAEREAQLLAGGAGTDQAVARARARLAIATSGAESARRIADLYASVPVEELGSTAARVEIAAPFEATVRSMQVSSETNVVAGAVVVDLVALDHLVLKVAIPVTEIGTIDATAPGWLVDRSCIGREVPTVPAFPRSDFASGTVELDYLLDNPDHAVRIGQRLSIRVQRKSPPQAVVIPASAVIFRPNGSALVYVAEGDLAFVQREVSLDRIENESAWILDGIRDDERVVARGVNEIHGAARTAPRGN
ncbi:MAG: hypothetical protein IPH13_12140 [Planctomycetes bacterium]|nr:hypothetical protein [Planctomycetota bacterium]